MAKQNQALVAFNRGLLSKYGLARVDLRRAALSAEIYTNFMPTVLGNMMLRPGLGYIGATLSNAQAINIPFVFSSSDTALLEFTNFVMRVRVNDVLVSRVSVSTTISNGTFASLVNWTSADETAATSTNTGSKLNLTGTGFNAAIRRQLVTVAGADQNKQHALRIVVERGPVTFKAGSTAGGDEYFETRDLKAGTHSLTLTPTGNFYVEFSSTSRSVKYVTSIAIEAAGAFTLPTPWATADLNNIRWDQSGDVIFVACDGVSTEARKPRRIERDDNNSWSLVEYFPVDGPFMIANTASTTIASSAQNGDVTLTASRPIFRATHVGALFQMTSNGQTVLQTLAGADQWTDHVRIVGVSAVDRTLKVAITGTWVGTLSLQRSYDAGITWTQNFAWTANATGVFYDGLDNQIVLYRIGFAGANYTSGSASVTISNNANSSDGTPVGGGIEGIVRITAYTSATVVSAAVLKSLGGKDGTKTWSEGAWSDFRKYPTAVALHEGRMWWAGRNRVWGSVSDAYDSFDDTIEGDSGPIDRTIGSGPIDNINFLLSLLRLVLGAQGSEVSVRSSSLDEPLTPTNFNLKASSTQGSAAVPALKVDDNGFFVSKSGKRLYRLDFAPQSFSYISDDQSKFVPDLVAVGITRIAVQRQPDTRIHCVLADGTVAVLLFDQIEEVDCWLKLTTDGTFEDVTVLPGTIEDQVYYTVNRTISGGTVRYIEKLGRLDQARGGVTNCIGDAYVTYSGVSTATITGLSHLEGKAVIAWGNGLDLSPDVAGVQTTYTVSGGQITLSQAVTTACVGLPYTAQFKSAKMAYAAELGTALTQQKKINHVGLILADVHPKGLQYGQDFAYLDDLPVIENEADVDQTLMRGAYDENPIPISGTWESDARLCLQSKAPRPCTVLGAVISIEEVDK